MRLHLTLEGIGNFLTREYQSDSIAAMVST
jgi:hypothetical protein